MSRISDGKLEQMKSEILKDLYTTIEKRLADRAVEIRGWGRIKTIMRKPKIGRNPRNSKIVKIPAKKAKPVVKKSKSIKKVSKK